ncbi:MAG: GntR family transcriptional regulator [Noviherbaspirillum sp.]
MNPANPIVPLYHQVYLLLRQQLVDGRADGAPLPSEMELAERFKVSRVTMRRAMDELVKKGLIGRQRGVGTFVKARPESQARAEGLLDNIITMARKTTVKVISVERLPADPGVARELELPSGDPVVKAVRLRSLAQVPVSHITTFVPAALGACLTPAALREKPMLSLLEENGVQPGQARQSISACLADTGLAALLEIEVGAALLSVKRLVRDRAGRPVQLLHGLYRPDRYEYRMELSRAGAEGASVWYPTDGIASI